MNSTRSLLAPVLLAVTIALAACDGPSAEPPVLAAGNGVRQVEASAESASSAFPVMAARWPCASAAPAYFVEGSGIDDHGDAHGRDGLCNAIRLAEVTGQVVDGRFRAERFVLVPSGR